MTPLLLALLAAEPVEAPVVPEPAEPELIERGGFHLLSIELTVGATVAGAFGFYGQDTVIAPYKPFQPAVLVGGVTGIVAGSSATGLLLAHYLRPSVGAAWAAGLMSLCAWSLSTGLAREPAVQRQRVGSRAFVDPDWAIAAAMSAAIGAAAGALMLLPPDRGRMSVWTTLLLAGATVTVTATYYFGGAAIGGPRGAVFVSQNVVFLPAITMTVFRMLQGFLLPNLFLD